MPICSEIAFKMEAAIWVSDERMAIYFETVAVRQPAAHPVYKFKWDSTRLSSWPIDPVSSLIRVIPAKVTSEIDKIIKNKKAECFWAENYELYCAEIF